MAGRRAATRKLFLEWLEAGRDQLPAGADVNALANYLAMVMSGMSALARDGVDGADLLALADRVMAAWPEKSDV